METEWTEVGPEVDIVNRSASFPLVVDDVVNQRDMAFRVLVKYLIFARTSRGLTSTCQL
jgi:hypothetical protein